MSEYEEIPLGGGAGACPRCGATFTCGMQAGWAECWCARLPPLARLPDAAVARCYCPDCLKALSALPDDEARR